MLATIITILILGGGGVTGLLFDMGEVKKQVKDVVKGVERRDLCLVGPSHQVSTL